MILISLKDKVPPEYLEDPAPDELVGAASRKRDKEGFYIPTPEEKQRLKEQFKRGRSRYDRRSQPRDFHGRFKNILARLKVDLGESELQDIVKQVEEAQQADQKSDYGKSSDAAVDVVQMIDRMETGALNPNQLQNLKDAARALGRVIAYLPMPQGQQNIKLRFSDLPPSTKQLLQNMETRIKTKLEPDQAAKLLSTLNQFTSGTVQLSSDDLQQQLARLLAYLID